MEHERIGVIMAGGSGERFWPLSRKLWPKQLLSLTRPDQSMLAEAVDRIADLIGPERVFIVTGQHLVKPIRGARVGVPDENVLAEPCKRNTAGALVFAAAHMLANRNEDPRALTMAVTTADHLILNEAAFTHSIETALATAEQEKSLVVLGVKPDRPETGYGYIERGETHAAGEGNRPAVCRAASFLEKPSAEKAADFLATGRFYWNSGMFFWRVADFLREFGAASPEFADAIEAMAEALRRGDDQRASDVFSALPSLSVDRALMEKAQRVYMVEADFGWDDVGSWPALERTLPADERGNVVIGEPIAVECDRCIIYNATQAGKTALGAVGMQDAVIVATDDAMLVMPKDRAQDVRAVVEELRRRNAPQT